MSNHRCDSRAFTDCACDLLGAAGSNVSRGIDAWNIGLELGAGLDEPTLVEVDGVLHKRGVRVQPDENERRGGIQLLDFVSFEIFDDDNFQLPVAFELPNGGVCANFHLWILFHLLLEDSASPGSVSNLKYCYFGSELGEEQAFLKTTVASLTTSISSSLQKGPSQVAQECILTPLRSYSLGTCRRRYRLQVPGTASEQ